MLTNPFKYLQVLGVAIRYGAIVEVALASYFAPKMKQHGVDRIHCHLGDRKLFTGYFCHLLTDIPLSVTIHAHELYVNPNEKLFPVALAACDHVICIADLNKRKLMESWGVAEEKLHVVRLFGFSDMELRNPLKIFCVGRFERKKGHDILLGAVARLLREDPGLDLEVWLAGGAEPGTAGVDVAGLARDLDIERNVIIFGEMEEQPLKVLYREADIFCLLSRHDQGVPEGIPVVLMEAMSVAKPVVATDTGATGELVEHILIQEDDPDAAFEAIKTLVMDADLRARQGAANYEIVRTDYSPDNVGRLAEILKV